MSERIILKLMNGTLIGEFDDFDHAVRVLGTDFVMAGNYLLEATYPENAQNRAKGSNNTSGFMGVSWVSTSQKWRAEICLGEKRRHLGYFDTPEAAHQAYVNAKKDIHSFNPVLRSSCNG